MKSISIMQTFLLLKVHAPFCVANKIYSTNGSPYIRQAQKREFNEFDGFTPLALFNKVLILRRIQNPLKHFEAFLRKKVNR